MEKLLEWWMIETSWTAAGAAVSYPLACVVLLADHASLAFLSRCALVPREEAFSCILLVAFALVAQNGSNVQ